MTLRFPSFSLQLRFSFFAVLSWMLLLCDRRITLVCFCSAMLHECGHFLALRLFGAKIESVSFGAAGVVITRRETFLLSGAKEVLVALCGVFMNAVLCLFALVFRPLLKASEAQMLLTVNILLAALNLLPIYPLDLWRALYAGLENRIAPERLERLLRSVSVCGTAAFCIFSLVYSVCIGWNVSLLAVCFYLILLNLKRRSTDV